MNAKKTEINERREHMKELIRKNPKLSGAKLNAEFKKKFGTQLRINTVYDLKEECGYDRNGYPVGSNTPMTVAEGGTGKGAALRAFPLLVQLGAGDTPISFAERLLVRLKGSGVVNLKVSGKSDTWVVIEPDA